MKNNDIFLTWLAIYSYVMFQWVFLYIKTMLMSKCLFIIWFRCIVVVTHWSISDYCMPVCRHTCQKYVVNEKMFFWWIILNCKMFSYQTVMWQMTLNVPTQDINGPSQRCFSFTKECSIIVSNNHMIKGLQFFCIK